MYQSAGPGRSVQAAHICRSVGVVEDVEQRTVDDGVVSRCVAEVHRVGDFEACVDALRGGILFGLFNRVR